MTRAVETIGDTVEAGVAALLRRFHRFRHLPVVDQAGRLVGMLTRSDLLEQAALGGGRRTFPVRDVMSSPCETIAPTAPLEEAARMLLARHIHALPVVDQGQRLAGIITDSDLLGAMSHRLKPEEGRAPEPAPAPRLP